MLVDRVEELLKDVRCIAVVGAKNAEGQPVDRVGRYLIEAGYSVFPVHPVRTNVWGLQTYKNLLEVPSIIDLVSIFRASIHCVEHAKECMRLLAYPHVFWMQTGIMNPEVNEILSSTDIKIVENACLMVEHQKMIAARQ